MASGRKMELRMLGSCFTLAALLMIATFSYQASIAAAADPALGDSVAEASTVGAEMRRSLIDLGGIASWVLKILNSLRHRIIDQLLWLIGVPPTNDIFWFLVKAVKFIYKQVVYFLDKPDRAYEMAVDWLIESVANPFRTIKKGVKSFDVLFKFIHKLRKGSHAGFFMNNPIYRCYLNHHPKCVKRAAVGSLLDWFIYQFYCAWQFYEECSVHYWWTKGKWKAPNVNMEDNDPCKYHPRGKCPDNPPKN